MNTLTNVITGAVMHEAFEKMNALDTFDTLLGAIEKALTPDEVQALGLHLVQNDAHGWHLAANPITPPETLRKLREAGIHVGTNALPPDYEYLIIRSFI